MASVRTTRRPQGARPSRTSTPSISAIDNRLRLEIPADVFTFEGFRTWAKTEGFPDEVRVTYVLIDARGDDVSLQILHWRKTGYAAAPQRDGRQRSRVFGRSFRLERQLDEFGLWEYTLGVRANG